MSKGSIYVGLDVGFGVTKTVTKDDIFSFPSIAGVAHQSTFGLEELSAKYPNQIISHDNIDYFVGDLAVSQLRARSQLRLRGRGDDSFEFRVLMMKSALAKILPNETSGDVFQFSIVTGLPVNHMSKSSISSLKSMMFGQHAIKTNGATFIADVVNVSVMPEPVGTMYAFNSTPKGEVNKKYTARTSAVINGGEMTIDVQVDREGEYIASQSTSSENGHHLALETLRIMYEDTYGETPDVMTLREILHKGFTYVSGEKIYFTDEVRVALKPVQDGALSLLRETIEQGRTIDSIIVSGALAITSFNEINEQYKQSMCSDNPLFDTAQGYYNYSQFSRKYL